VIGSTRKSLAEWMKTARMVFLPVLIRPWPLPPCRCDARIRGRRAPLDVLPTPLDEGRPHGATIDPAAGQHKAEWRDAS
jgi:hypothetical protein